MELTKFNLTIWLLTLQPHCGCGNYNTKLTPHLIIEQCSSCVRRSTSWNIQKGWMNT